MGCKDRHNILNHNSLTAKILISVVKHVFPRPIRPSAARIRVINHVLSLTQPLPENSVYTFLASCFPNCVTFPSTRTYTLFITPFFMLLPSYINTVNFLPTSFLLLTSLLTSHSSILPMELATSRFFGTTNFLLFFSTPSGAGGSSLHSSYFSPPNAFPSLENLWGFPGFWLSAQRAGAQPRPNQPPTNPQPMPNQ